MKTHCGYVYRTPVYVGVLSTCRAGLVCYLKGLKLMGDFVFNLSPTLVAGTDVLLSLGERVQKYGQRFMLILDPSFKDMEIVLSIKRSLEQKALKLFSFDGIKKSVDTETVMRTLKLAKVAHIDAVIVLGDVITCSLAKAISSLYNETEAIYNYLEGQPILGVPLPLIQIPTSCDNPFLFSTSLYLSDSRNRHIAQLKCKEDISSLVFFDSNVFKSLSLNSLNLTIFAGLALAIDAYVSRKANFFSDALLKKAISLFVHSFRVLNENLAEGTIEQIVIQATLLNAIALSSSSPGMAMAVAEVGNGKYDLSIPQLLTIMLPSVLEDSIPSNLSKVADIVSLFIKDSDKVGIGLEDVTHKGIEELINILLKIGLPVKFQSLDLELEDITSMADAVLSVDFINYIPRSMTSLDILELLKKAY